jgi:hypothetical protein
VGAGGGGRVRGAGEGVGISEASAKRLIRLNIDYGQSLVNLGKRAELCTTVESISGLGLVPKPCAGATLNFKTIVAM